MRIDKHQQMALIFLATATLVASVVFLMSDSTVEKKTPPEVVSNELIQMNDTTEYLDQLEYEKIIEIHGSEFMKVATDGGGSLFGYVYDDDLVKIVERIGLSFGVAQTTYILEDDELVAVYFLEEHFPYLNGSGTLEYSKLEFGFEARYYYRDKVMIETEKKGERRLTKEDPDDIGAYFLERSSEYKTLIDSKR